MVHLLLQALSKLMMMMMQRWVLDSSVLLVVMWMQESPLVLLNLMWMMMLLVGCYWMMLMGDFVEIGAFWLMMMLLMMIMKGWNAVVVKRYAAHHSFYASLSFFCVLDCVEWIHCELQGLEQVISDARLSHSWCSLLHLSCIAVILPIEFVENQYAIECTGYMRPKISKQLGFGCMINNGCHDTSASCRNVSRYRWSLSLGLTAWLLSSSLYKSWSITRIDLWISLLPYPSARTPRTSLIRCRQAAYRTFADCLVKTCRHMWIPTVDSFLLERAKLVDRGVGLCCCALAVIHRHGNGWRVR